MKRITAPTVACLLPALAGCAGKALPAPPGAAGDGFSPMEAGG